MAYADGGEDWLDEAHPLDTSPGRAGICAPVVEMERMVRAADPARLGWVILRGGQFVGPGTGQAGLIERLRSGAPTMPCSGQNWLSLVNPEDFARACLLGATVGPAGATINVCAEPVRNSDYLRQLADIAGATAPTGNRDQPCPPSFRCSNARAAAGAGLAAGTGGLPRRQILSRPALAPIHRLSWGGRATRVPIGRASGGGCPPPPENRSRPGRR